MLHFLFVFAAFSCWAQSPAAPPDSAASGYVVKVESRTVYLDAGEPQGARPGMSFTLYTEGEELKHPVTGASLGRIEAAVAAGEIVEAHEKYSLGRLPPGPALPEGRTLRYHLRAAPQPASPPKAVPPAGPAGAEAARPHLPVRKSPLLDIEAADLTFADVDGDGRPEVILAGKDAVEAFAEDGFRSVCRFKDPATATQFFSVEAQDLDGDGRAEAFATLYNRIFERAETYVLVCSSGAFRRAETLPWMVRRFQDETGAGQLAAQELRNDPSFPFGPIKRLRWADGRYAVADKVKYPRVEWLYGFGVARNEAGTFPFFLTHVNRLRLQFEKKPWTTPDAYGQTSSRLRRQDRLFQFNPRFIPDAGPSGFEGLYALRNVARFGALSESFGAYSSAELHRLRWTGMSLAPDWKAELPGYASGLAERPGAPGELAVSIVGPNDKTLIWYFEKSASPQ